MNRSPEVLHRNFIDRVRKVRRPAAILAAAALSGCGGLSLSVERTSESTTTTEAADTGPRWYFDDNGKGFPVIFVYGNPDREPAPYERTPTYRVGTSLPAICIHEGMQFEADDPPNEDGKFTSDWVALGGIARGYWAPAEYGYLEPLGTELPEC